MTIPVARTLRFGQQAGIFSDAADFRRNLVTYDGFGFVPFRFADAGVIVTLRVLRKVNNGGLPEHFEVW